MGMIPWTWMRASQKTRLRLRLSLRFRPRVGPGARPRLSPSTRTWHWLSTASSLPIIQSSRLSKPHFCKLHLLSRGRRRVPVTGGGRANDTPEDTCTLEVDNFWLCRGAHVQEFADVRTTAEHINAHHNDGDIPTQNKRLTKMRETFTPAEQFSVWGRT